MIRAMIDMPTPPCALTPCPHPATRSLYNHFLCQNHYYTYHGLPRQLNRRIAEREWYIAHGKAPVFGRGYVVRG